MPTKKDRTDYHRDYYIKTQKDPKRAAKRRRQHADRARARKALARAGERSRAKKKSLGRTSGKLSGEPVWLYLIADTGQWWVDVNGRRVVSGVLSRDDATANTADTKVS